MSLETWAFIGDLHLGARTSLIPNHLDLQFQTLDDILQSISKHPVTDVVLLGDVLDTPQVNVAILRRLIKWLSKYKQYRWHWVCGNHDRTSNVQSSVDLVILMTEVGRASNLTLYLEPTKRGRVSFLPYPHKQPLKGTDLCIAHCDRPGARRDNGQLIKCRDNQWPEKIHFVIGHNHTAQKINRTIYTGTPYQISVSESPKKHWGLVTFETDRKLPLNFTYRRMKIKPRYTLEKRYIEKPSQLKRLSPEGNRYYHLELAPGLEIPANFWRDNPHCYQGSSLKRSQSLSETLTTLKSNWTPQEGDKPAIRLDPRRRLKSWLRENAALKQREVRWALRQVDEFLEGVQGGKTQERPPA